MSLSLKRQDFIRYYVLTKNATESAKQSGYSPKSAYSTGQRLLKNAEIVKEIERLCIERAKEYQLTKEQYIKKTYDLHKEEGHSNVKARYWELLGKAKGFIKPEGTQNIALFGELTKALQESYERMKEAQRLKRQGLKEGELPENIKDRMPKEVKG